MSEPVITRIGTGKPEELRKQLTNEASNFFTQIKPPISPQDPLVQKLLKLVEGGENVYPHNFNTRTPEAMGITLADLRRLQLGAEFLSLMITVRDSGGNEVQLIPGEFNAWQGIATGGTVPAGPSLPIDKWAASINVAIQDSGPRYVAGDQTFHIESPTGSKRIVRAGRTATREYGDLSYGSTEIIDNDKGSPTYGHPANMGDGAQDVWIPKPILEELAAGKPYYGPVTIKLRTEGTRSDPQIFLGATSREAILAESKNWQAGETQEISALAGEKFTPPIPLQKSLIDNLNNSKTVYTPMNGPQYQAWKYALSDDATLRTISPLAWIENQFGDMKKFQDLFPENGNQKLTREAYESVMKANNTIEKLAPTILEQIEAIPKIPPMPLETGEPRPERERSERAR